MKAFINRLLNRYRKPLWTIHGYYGAGRIMLGRMSRERAIQVTAKEFGTVMFVDDENAFIFYKPKELPK